MASKFVPVHGPSAEKAMALCKGIRSMQQRYEIITQYVDNHIVYDYIRAAVIPKRNGLPDVAQCWNRKMGICLDIAAMTAGMLRAVSIPASLVIGLADGHRHAWVEARVDGKRYLYDHESNGKVKSYKRERMY